MPVQRSQCMRVLYVALFAVIASFAASCEDDPADSGETTPTAILYGTVRSAAGKPMAASVKVRNWPAACEATGGGFWEVAADLNGKFRVVMSAAPTDDDRRGCAQVAASAPGHTPATIILAAVNYRSSNPDSVRVDMTLSAIADQ